MATVRIDPDLSAHPPTIQIHGGETVTWEGVSDYKILLPAPYRNPDIGNSGGKFGGTSQPFPAQAQKYTVHYAVAPAGGGAGHDPDIEVLP
jgi:hypothetical protein